MFTSNYDGIQMYNLLRSCIPSALLTNIAFSLGA